MAGLDIAEFRQKALGAYNGVMRPNLFYVEIDLPLFIRGYLPDDARVISLFAESAMMPGVTIATDDTIRRHGYGPTEKVGYMPIFTDNLMHFIGDGKGIITNLFHKWIQLIVSYDAERGIASKVNGRLPYTVAYKDDYAVNMRITLLDAKGDKLITYQLNDAFPISVQDVPLSWSDKDNYLKIPVNITYKQWTAKLTTGYEFVLGVTNAINGVIIGIDAAGNLIRNTVDGLPHQFINEITQLSVERLSNFYFD